MRINDVLKGKARQDLVTISPAASLRDLVALLTEQNVGAVIVSGDGTTLDGIVSERDVVRRLASGETALEGTVGQIMSPAVHTCAGDESVTDLMQVMTQHRIRHVPVLSDGVVTGIVSIGDVVKNRIDQLEFERDQLDQYLHQP